MDITTAAAVTTRPGCATPRGAHDRLLAEALCQRVVT
jgi:hypothetical protein